MKHQEETLKKLEDIYNSLIVLEKISHLPYPQSMEHLGTLVDISLDLGRVEGLEHAKRLAEALSERELTSKQYALLHYFRSNIWANLASLHRISAQENGIEEMARVGIWEWEQEEAEKQIFHLRAALRESGFQELPEARQCQILTNLANLYDTIGRFVEAIEYWNRAISIIPSFGMALGNIGIGLTHYANSLYDLGHRCNYPQKLDHMLSETLVQ